MVRSLQLIWMRDGLIIPRKGPYNVYNDIFRQGNPNDRSARDFLEFMLAGATSKTFASSLCYPHGKYSGENTMTSNKHAQKFWGECTHTYMVWFY